MLGQEERGSIMIIVIIAMTSLLIMGSAFLTNSLTENLITQNQEENIRLHYITESGLEAGIAVLQENFSPDFLLKEEISGGSFEVEFEALNSNRRLLRSTGTLGENSLTLELVLEKYRSPAHNAYDKALLISNDGCFENIIVYGDVHVNKEMQVRGENNQINGILNYSDKPPQFIGRQSKIQINNNTYISSLEFDDSYKTDFIAIPEIDITEFEEKADIVYSGNQIILSEPPEPEHKKILIQGNLVINPGNNFNYEERNFTYEGMIVVTGDATIQGPINADNDNNILLLTKGDLTINKEEPLGGNWLLYTMKNAISQSNSEENEKDFIIRGAIMAKHNPPGLGLHNFTLYHEPSVLFDYADDLPEYGENYAVTIVEWRKP